MINLKINNLLGKTGPKVELGNDPKSDLESLLQEVKKHLKDYDEQKIRQAFRMCLHAHSNKVRKSGEPFYTHPLQVARILINEIPLDDESVIAALLHDVLDEPELFTYKDIQLEFGTTIADIVEGVHKIEHIESTRLHQIDQLENYRRLLLSMLKDVRIILIKLADRLHNMRTIEYLSENAKVRAAKETVEVYVPFANRFGLRNLKWELEDSSFKYLNPKAYYDIKSKLNSTRAEREKYIKDLIEPIEEKLHKDPFLRKNKIKFSIKGRPKHIYSIYNKMIARQKSMEELYDLHAFRVILDTDDPYMCFYVYGIIASIYQPIPGTFKDYISSPKKNGYQSIHCGLIGKNNIAVEMQIRTHKMHVIAEKGVAAHFKYKEGEPLSQSIMESDEIQKWISEVREIFEHAGTSSTEHLLDNVRKNLLFDEIYVFTPANEFITLPRDSTPLDFAFEIHSELGFRYLGAKVNGKIVPMDHNLQSGDQIEILTSEKHEPDPSWLHIARTSKAKSQINKYFKEKDKQIEEKGKNIWQEKTKERGFNLTEEQLSMLVRSLKFSSVDEFYQALGKDDVDLSRVYLFIKMKIKDGFKIPASSKKQEFMFSTGRSDKVNLSHANDMMHKNYNDVHNGYKQNGKANGEITVTLKITALSSQTVINDLNNLILEETELDILGVTFDTGEKNLTGKVKLKMSDHVILNNTVDKLKMISGVHSVEILN